MTEPAGTEQPLFIDTDIHNAMPDLFPYLPRQWHDRWRALGTGASTNYFNPRGVADVT